MTIKDQERVSELVRPFAGKPSELIQALHQVHRELGHVPKWVQAAVAEALGVPPAQVRGVVTFYQLFRTEPVGKHTVRVCLGTACHVRGGERVLKALEEETGTKTGKTSRDGAFTVEVVRCLGACGLAPVMMINEDVYGRLDPRKARKIVKELRGTGP